MENSGKKYVGGGVRIYYFDVNKESKKKYDNIIKSIRIRKLWRPKSPASSNEQIKWAEINEVWFTPYKSILTR